MIAYRLGRIFQILALIDCGIALFFGGSMPRAGLAAQFNILLFAVVLFGAGRLLQRRGEASLRARQPGVADAEERT